MRITKKWLRGAKGKLIRRIHIIVAMTDDELRVEFSLLFPSEELGPTICLGDVVKRILLWSVEESIPSAMVD